MLTVGHVEKLLDPTSEGNCQLLVSKRHQCLIKGITDDACVLSLLRGLPHVVLYIFNLVEDFTTTLRNISYVMKDPGQKLLAEYAAALKYTSGETKVALKHWLKFVNIYAPFMKENPSSSRSLAVNQVYSSYVYLDTKEWEGKSIEEIPLYWLNRPHEQHDSILMRYANGTGSMSCAATSLSGNLVAFSVEDRVSVYQMATGILQYQLETRFFPPLAFGNDDTELLVADDNRGLLVYDAVTGNLKWLYEINIPILLDGEQASDWIIWMQYVGDSIVLGTYAGNVLFILSSSHVAIDSWTLDEDATTYCYHPNRHWLLSGHESRKIVCWTMSGVRIRTLQVEGEVVDVAIHPTNDEIIASTVRCRNGRRTYETRDKHIQLSIQTDDAIVSAVEETNNSLVECRSFLGYIFIHGKVRLVCISEEWLLVCDIVGKVVSSVGRINEEIHKICLVPNTSYVLATGEYDCYLYDVAGSCDERIQDGIGCCAFLHCGDYFVTLSFSGKVQKWSSKTFESSPFVIEDSGYRFMTAHPLQDIVVLATKEKLLFMETTAFQTISEYEIHSANENIQDIVISENGEKLVLSRYSGISVYNISDLSNIQLICECEAFHNRAADIHRDGERILTMGEAGVVLWHITPDLEDGSSSLTGRSGNFVRFMYDPDRIVCVNDTDVQLLTLDGALIRTIKIASGWEAHLVNNTHLITGDDFIELHDLRTGDRCTSVFYHHPSRSVTSFAIKPDLSMVIVGNVDGKIYALNLWGSSMGGTGALER